jgi:hypothetical protein
LEDWRKNRDKQEKKTTITRLLEERKKQYLYMFFACREQTKEKRKEKNCQSIQVFYFSQ